MDKERRLTAREDQLKDSFVRGLAGDAAAYHRFLARITTHYSAAELSKLIEAANRVCESDRRQPELVVLRRVSIA